MKRKAMPVIAAIVLIIVLAAIGVITHFIEKYTPTDERLAPEEYFNVSAENELALILQDTLSEEKGILKDGIVYLSHSMVKELLNSRFYWDAKENLMVYTTPTDIITIPAGSKNYTISGNNNSEPYEIVKVDGTECYIAADFVQKYTNMEFALENEPNRCIIRYTGTESTYVNAKKDGSVRREGGIKSLILTDVEKGAKLLLIDQMDEWSKVMTQDGYIGYIENKKLGSEPYKEKTELNYQEPEYTSVKKDYKINMVWHQITSQDANYNLPYDIANMKGVNTISPTWFSIATNEGDISSLANEAYVSTAHQNNLEVWALVDNFSENISTTQVLSTTSSREKLSNQLIAAAIQYGLDGINVDFEAIPEEAADGYIQFIRELSVKCRKNGFVLSVDVPVPMPYTAHYNRKEQGIVADYVIIMGYDEHHTASEKTGSVASLPFVKNGIVQTLEEVPAEKIISGLPFYTRLWKTDTTGKISSEAYGMNGADDIVANSGVNANWSTDTSQDYAEFSDADGNFYQIWLENEKSLEEKAKLTKEYNLGGIAAWKLGLERSSIWDILLKYAS